MQSDYSYQAPFGHRSGGPGRTIYDCSSCGKRFSTTRLMDNHERSKCQDGKRSLAEMLEESKALWEVKKKRRIEALLQPPAEEGQSHLDSVCNVPPSPTPEASQILTGAPQSLQHESVSLSPPTRATPATSQFPIRASAPLVEGGVLGTNDLDVSVATRKGVRAGRPDPRHPQDDIPQTHRPAQAEGQPGASNRLLEAQNLHRGCPPGEGCVQADAPAVPVQEEPASANVLCVLDKLVSKKPSRYGVSRAYTMRAGFEVTHDPDQVMITPEDLTDTPKPARQAKAKDPHPYGPFPNISAFSLAEWYWNSTQKSFSDFQNLIKVFREPSFHLNDVVPLNWRDIFQTLGANKVDLIEGEADWIRDSGWKTTPIYIDVPFHNRMKDSGVESFFAGNLRHRSIASVIREKIANERDSRQFHYYPYRATWKPTDSSAEVELYGELYASRVFRDAHEALQRDPMPDTNPNIERVVVALMFWSDSTHLTSFGTASLWPCYLFFGNESKYKRCQPSEGLCNHIAYFQKIPDAFTDYLKERNAGKIPKDALLTHCIREMFQRQWSILLDKELIHAMKNGLLIVCPDGKPRLFFPRVFTYSADYPEKTLTAGIRPNGLRPCPRCLVAKSDMGKLGAPTDVERVEKQRDENQRRWLVASAREDIVKGCYAVDGTAVEAKLKPLSLVPVENAFSLALAPFGFSIFSSMVVDLMHEFEIGVWKRLFIHLIRLLDAFTTPSGPTLSAELDARFRATPPFGRNTIRKFGLNASAMKRKAARDYEDLLQCAVPAFDGLIPEPHGSIVTDLLFTCAEWHALAKLRLHNDLTLKLLEHTTTLLGAHMRRFDQETCATVRTKELAKEAEARARREGKGNAGTSVSRKPARLNMYTIKFHFLGDYPAMIRQFGTSDSYTTEVGELCHREPKAWYARTDKKEFEHQISQIERRQTRLAAIREGMVAPVSAPAGSCAGASRCAEPPPDGHYTMALSQNSGLDLSISFANQYPNTVHHDHYITDFIPKVKQHLLPRILKLMGVDPGKISSATWPSVILKGNRLYPHQILHCSYTAYDVRRDEDVVHVNTPQCNVMVLNGGYKSTTWTTEHPYMYGRVIGIYHANVSYIGVLPDGTRRYGWHRIDFLWIHWYDLVSTPVPFRLDRVAPAPLNSGQAIGFLDPGSSVVKTDDLWREFYINRFVDRDMFMRFQYGMSVGHTYMKSNFPPPKTPFLPAGFNHYLPDSTSVSPDPSAAPSSTDTTRPANDDADVNAEAILGPSAPLGQPDCGELGAPINIFEGPPLADQEYLEPDIFAPVDGDEDLSEEVGRNDPMDYIDDMDDHEFAAYYAMYSGPHNLD